jgi:enoyl-CoA hydratase
METLQLERSTGVAPVGINRPPVNPVNDNMARELTTCFDELSEDRDINAVVLTTAGDRAFCGGTDLKQRSQGERPASVHTLLDPAWEWRRAQTSIRECLVPVIAAVERPAIGAGFGLIAVCDLMIAGEDATFGLSEINVGVLGGASNALRLVGPSKARRMVFFGELPPAVEMHRLGGIEEVVAAGRAEKRALELAGQLAPKSPIALRLAKESILRIEGDQLMERYRTENDYTNRLRTYNDSGEAVNVYLNKRPPEWTWS